jgi:hypothetical protein
MYICIFISGAILPTLLCYAILWLGSFSLVLFVVLQDAIQAESKSTKALRHSVETTEGV